MNGYGLVFLAGLALVGAWAVVSPAGILRLLRQDEDDRLAQSAVRLIPSSCVDRDLRADLYSYYFSSRPDRVHEVRETSSRPATCIENVVPGIELKKLRRFAPRVVL